ncbi:MAG: carbohydrate binding family 9 domain-containing protein [candidate division Zixibacteria bacterium]|nr:carbohydrate binding family 9 domain-containing protein [candidate division Zixibacteria bacterium]
MRSSYNFRRIFSIFTFIILSQIIIPVTAGADGSYQPVYNPTMEVSKLRGTINIDGDLDDSGWQTAAKADNFAEHTPGDQTQPPVNTEALITYDDDNLYVAYICYDDPTTIRASFAERDRGIWQDDNICFLLDTYGNGTWAYELNVNPYGIQGDHLWSQYGGEDVGYDLIWESAGKITDKGYQIEMAIPFSSLRFPNKEKQVWKIDFWRNHPREVRRQYSWAAYDREETCWPCQWGTVTGIDNIKPGKGLEIIPTVIGFQSGELDDDDNFQNSDPDGDISLGAKYSITSDIVAEATYNPDFSQIEADASQIDVNTTFALFYNERRPFFQEGSDLYRTIFNTVYTRSINNPQFAGKVTARMNKTSFAYMIARDENTPVILPFEESSTYLSAGKSVSNIFRARRSLGDNSHIGLLLTDRRLDEGGSGTLLSLDGSYKVAKGYILEWQFIGTNTEEPDDTTMTYDENDTTFNSTVFDSKGHTAGFDGESFGGHAIYAGMMRETANSFMEIGYLERSPTFRADNGFQPQNNQRRPTLFGMYHFRFDDGLIERLTPSISLGQVYNFDKVKKDEWIKLELSKHFRLAQSEIHSRYEKNSERLAGIKFGGIWDLHTCLNGRPGKKIAFGGSFNYGHIIARGEDPPVMGKRISYSAWIDLKPFDRIWWENSINFQKSDSLDNDGNIYKGYIYWSRLNYQIFRPLSLRLVFEYDNFDEAWSIDPLLTYRLNPFSIFYIGSTSDIKGFENDDEVITDWKLNSRQFFLKLQYLFQM